VNVALISMEEPGDLLAMSVLYCLRNMKARTWLVSDGKAQVYRYSRYCSRFVQMPLPGSPDDATLFGCWLTDFVKRYSITVYCHQI
jgi:hypothetical protein